MRLAFPCTAARTFGPAFAVMFSLACAGSPLRAQSIPGAVLAMREPHHHLVYQDDALRVLRVRVPARDTTLLHEHDPDYFWIALGASDVVNAKLGASDAVIHSDDLSIHYTVGKFAHIARNPGAVPFDNITVELLHAQTNVRNLCAPAIATQPLDCAAKDASRASVFRGADEMPAFATDQMRVSLMTIAPGKTLSSNAVSLPATIIALDTIDTRHALAIKGGGRWIGGVFRPASATAWTVTNVGASPLRVLAVVSRAAVK